MLIGKTCSSKVREIARAEKNSVLCQRKSNNQKYSLFRSSGLQIDKLLNAFISLFIIQFKFERLTDTKLKRTIKS